ncbi:MAG: Ig-like domain-containing protein, partial [Burkholderiales bacterium]|nr:Ig-like domain-containing protein [Burkholderiales bacterium]
MKTIVQDFSVRTDQELVDCVNGFLDQSKRGKQMKKMSKFESFSGRSRFMTWLMALMLTAFAAGCGGGGDGGRDPVLGINGAGLNAPTVTATVPVRAITGMPINRAITATFSEAMDPATINATTFLLREFNSTGVLSSISGEVSFDATNNIATFTPGTKAAPVSLAVATSYQATITAGAKNPAGTPIAAEYTWSFNTALTADTTTPLVIATSAYGTTGTLTGATGLLVNRDSTATFNEAMDPASITAATFTVTCALPCVNPAGDVTYAGNTATFNPTGDLAPNTTYTSTITTGAKDLAGNALAANYVWDWTTAAAAVPGDTTAPTVTLTNPAALAIDVPVTQSINATFSEEMRQGTMITTNFTLTETATPL